MSFATGFPTYTLPVTVQARNAASGSFDYTRWAWLYDFNAMDFARDAAGRFIKTDGYTAWGQRLIKRLLTRKYSSPLYGLPFTLGYGTRLDIDMRQPGRIAQQRAIQQDAYEQVTADPGTKDADSFSFAFAGNECFLSFRALPWVGNPQLIRTPDLVRMA